MTRLARGVGIVAAGALTLSACGEAPPSLPPEQTVVVPGEGTVAVYVEARRGLAGPVLKTFEEQTGIKVQATYREQVGDGFSQTLRTEAGRRNIDVVWTDSPLLAYDLVDAGLAEPFRPVGARPVLRQYRDGQFRWVGFAVDPRVIIYNSKVLARDDAPDEMGDLVRAPWAGKGAMTRTRFGAPAYFGAALFALLGPEKARTFFEALRKDGTRIVDSDHDVRALVAAGGANWGVVGLDEAICAKREGEPVNILFPDRLGMGAIVPPQAVVLVRDAPHPAQARGLFGYLFASEAAWMVGQNDCALITLIPDIPRPDWVPALGAFNIAELDPFRGWKTWHEQAAYLEDWGREQEPADAPKNPPRAALVPAPHP